MIAPPALLLLDIGPMEFLVLAATAVMLFGGDLPDVMRRAGRLVSKLRGMAADLGRAANLRDDVTRLTGTAREITSEIAGLPREVTAAPGATAADTTPPGATPADASAPAAAPSGPPAAPSPQPLPPARLETPRDPPAAD